MSLTYRTCHRISLYVAALLTVGPLIVTDTSGQEIFGGAPRGMTEGASVYEQARIDSIIVDNRNIYDLSDRRFNRFPFKAANKLHLVTRRSVIERELLFKVGDPFSHELAEETARNLRTRLALYEAWVDTEMLADGRLLVRVVTIAQWSIILSARLTREANLTDIRFGFEERNLLGRNQLLSLEYFIAEGEKNHVNMAYANPRFMGRSVNIGAKYDSDPADEMKEIAVSHPYYNLRQLLSWSASLERGTVSTDDPDNNLKHYTASNQTQLSLGTRWGSYHDKIVATGEYTYRSSETHASAYNQPDSIVLTPFDSAYHLLMLNTGFQRIYYVGMKRINGFNYTEDIEMGLTATVGLGRAFSRRWDNYLFNQFALQITSVRRFGQGLFMLSYERLLWFPKDGPTLQSADMSLRVYETGLSWVTFAFRARGMGYRQGDVLAVAEEPSGDRRLASPRRRRQHQHQPSAGDRLHRASLDVLDLLAQLIDHRLELEPGPADFNVGGLGAERIRLAIELLRQEFEFAPDRLIAVDELVRCRNMSAQAIEFLLDIGLGGQQQSFLVEPFGVED